MKHILGVFFILFALNLSAQKKQKIWVTPPEGNITKGILTGTTDSSVHIFPGNFSQYNRQPDASIVSHHYSNIIKIKTHKKGGLLKGILIGGAIGIAPILVGSLFGPSTAEGGAYVSALTFPLGILTGAIIGGTSKKKFSINRDASRFVSFRNRMKY